MSKKVTIKITGSILGIDYFPYDLEKYPGGYWYETWGFQEISSITVDGEDIQKKKGKYVKDDYFKKLFGGDDGSYTQNWDWNESDGEEPEWDGGMYLYFKYWPSNDSEAEYVIELEDGEEFDPKQLQLIRTEELYRKYLPFDIKEQGDYDSLPPYYIVADEILYKGKSVSMDDPWDVSPLSKMYYECKIEVREKDKEIPTMYPSK
jgi:hypothetical protein